jgi:hypothetical protein
MAINSIVQSDSITVFGPPEVIEVGLDIGPSGERGSVIYSGSGDPNINTGAFINESAKVKDLYVRTDAGGNYGVVYQYNSVPSGNEWQSVLKFQPSIYTTIEDLVFTSGSATVNIPVADFYQDAPATLASTNISIQLTPEHSEAIAYSILSKGIVNSGTRNLVFTVKAKQIAGSTTDLSGTVKFNVFISIVI